MPNTRLGDKNRSSTDSNLALWMAEENVKKCINFGLDPWLVTLHQSNEEINELLQDRKVLQ